MHAVMPQRLFIGLELPGTIQETLAALDPKVAGLRWLAPEQMHLTMSFLGNVKTSDEERLQEALATVQVPPFFLPVEGVGAFGGAKPTVVWAGVGKGHPHLFALHKRIQDAVLNVGLPGDLRAFHPHVTIGRAKDVARAALQPFLRAHAATQFGLWKVSGFTLFSSMLSSLGATHSVEMVQVFSRDA